MYKKIRCYLITGERGVSLDSSSNSEVINTSSKSWDDI